MDFDLPEQHRLLRDSVREFCERHVRPHAREWDEAERFPLELVPKLAELGLLGIRVPEEYGGSGLDTLSYAIAVEECARVDGSLALTVASHNGLGTGHILKFGTEEQKQRYLPKAATGEWLAAWALTEPGSGSDAAALKTIARREGDEWVIDGTKMFITQGSVGGFCVVLAKTNKDAPPQRGITAFIVETSTAGYSASKKLKKYGCRSSDTVELTFEEVRVSDAQRLGAVDHGFLDTMRILDGGRVSIAAMALGLGRGALQMALALREGSRGLRQADRRPSGDPVDAGRREDGARRGGALDSPRRLARGSGAPFTAEASMAKLFASEVATRVCNNSLQIHGGYGYTREFDVERHLRDAKLCEIGEGTSQVQRMVIAKGLLR